MLKWKSCFVIGGTRRQAYFPYKKKPVVEESDGGFQFQGKFYANQEALLLGIEKDLGLITQFNDYLNKVVDQAYMAEMSRQAKTSVNGCLLIGESLHIIQFSRDEDSEGVRRIHHFARLIRRIEYRLCRAKWFQEKVGIFRNVEFYSIVPEINF